MLNKIMKMFIPNNPELVKLESKNFEQLTLKEKAMLERIGPNGFFLSSKVKSFAQQIYEENKKGKRYSSQECEE